MPTARAILRTFKTSLVPINHEMHSRSYDFLYLLQDWYGVFVLCFVGSPVSSIGSLSNDDSYAVDNVG